MIFHRVLSIIIFWPVASCQLQFQFQCSVLSHFWLFIYLYIPLFFIYTFFVADKALGRLYSLSSAYLIYSGVLLVSLQCRMTAHELMFIIPVCLSVYES
jgi:hypothetical protein